MCPETEPTPLNPEEQMIFDRDVAQLKAAGEAHGFKGFEARTQFGLDPAAMLTIDSAKADAEAVAEKLGTTPEAVWAVVKELHTSGPWAKSDQLSAAADPAVRAYLVLAAACHESGWPGFKPDEYMQDRERVIADLKGFDAGQFDAKRQEIVDRVKIDHVVDGVVPVAEGDVALPLAIQGYKGCVAKAGEMRFAQTTNIPDQLLEQHGLVKGFAEVFAGPGNFQRVALDSPEAAKGRVIWVEAAEQSKPLADMAPAAKRIAPGYVLAYGNEKLAVDLVKDAIGA